MTDIPADRRRRKLTLTERLAAMICHLTVIVDDETGAKVPLIDPQWAKMHSAKDIVAVFQRWHQWDHRIALELNGTNHPTNIDPLPLLTHQTQKTPRDQTAIAKARRITAAQEEFRRRLLAKAGNEDPPPATRKPKWRPLPGTKASGWKHGMDGTWSRRAK